VALKVLHTYDPAALKHEFRALEGIRHPSLVRLLELHVESGAAWYTMKLVEGTSLDEYVAGAPALPRLASALRDVCAALAALHGAGRVHRDVKPDNIRVSPRGPAILVDPGLVVDVAAETSFLPEAGTLAWQAPEQTEGGQVSTAADIFALGAIWRELAPLSSVAPPDEVAEAMRRALAHAPNARPTAGDLLARLERWLGPAPAPRPRPEFIGRAAELGTLLADYDAWDGRGPTLLTVLGAPGVGRSRLIHEWARAVNAAGGLALLSPCSPSEAIPFQAIDRLLERVARALRRGEIAPPLDPIDRAALAIVFPALGAALTHEPHRAPRDAEKVRDRAFEVARALVRTFVGQVRVALVLDDAQWLDPDSRALLDTLLRAPTPVPLCVVRTLPTHEPRSPTWDMDEHSITLGGLAPDEARMLALASGAEPSLLPSLLETAGANPALLVVLAAVSAPTLQDWLSVAEARHGPAAMALLRTLAIAEAPLEPSGVALVLPAARACVRELQDLQLLRQAPIPAEGGVRLGITIAHTRVAVLLRSEIPPEDRGAMHARVARWLEETNDPRVELLARHLLSLGEVERAFVVLRATAERAERTQALGRAFAIYEQLVEMEPGRASPGLHERLAVVAGALGHADVAARAWRSVVEHLPENAGAARIRAMTHHVEQAFHWGDLPSARAALDRLLHQIGHPLPRSRAALWGAVAWRRLSRLWLGVRWDVTAEGGKEAVLEALWVATMSRAFHDLLEQEYLGLAFVSEALRGAPAWAVSRALAWEGGARERFGLAASGERLSASAIRVAAETGRPFEQGLTLNFEVLRQFSRGDNAACLEVSRRALAAYAEDSGATYWGEMNIQVFASGTMWYAGEVRALREFVHKHRLDDRVGDLAGAYDDGHGWTAIRVALLEGHVGRAENLLDACEERWRSVGPSLGAWSRGLARAEIAAARGEAAAAAALLPDANRLVWRSGVWIVPWVAGTWWFMRSGFELAASAERGEGRVPRLVLADIRRLRSSRWTLGEAAADVLEGCLLAVRGTPELSLAPLERARQGGGLLGWWAGQALAQALGSPPPTSLDPEIPPQRLAASILSLPLTIFRGKS